MPVELPNIVLATGPQGETQVLKDPTAHHVDRHPLWRQPSTRLGRITFVLLAAGLLSLTAAPVTGAAPSAPMTTGVRPGPLGPTSALLVDGRTVAPAGLQTPLEELPLNAVLSPDGRTLLITDDGRRDQYLQVISTATSQVQQSIKYPYPSGLFVGIAYNATGTEAYASGGEQGVIHTFDVAPDGTLSPRADIPATTSPTSQSLLAGLAPVNGGRLLYVAVQNPGGLAVVDTTTEKLIRIIPLAGRPYAVLAAPDSKSVYVSNWDTSTVSVVDTATGLVTHRVHVGAHPTAMVLSAQGILYVTDSDADEVSAISARTDKLVGRISVGPFSGAPLGSSPEGIAVDRACRYLYVANSGENAVVVLKLTDGGTSASTIGRIPTAEYPTSVTLGPTGGQLFITNGDGYGTGPNGDESPIHYSNTILGTMSTVTVPDLPNLTSYTAEVASNNNMQNAAPATVPAGLSAIKHVILVVKQDQSYDQVLGDLQGTDGDPALTKYPEQVTPNIHELAREFGVFDNYYTDGQTSADSDNLLLSADANDFDMKIWPETYGHRDQHGYYQGESAMDLSPNGYLWDLAARDGVTYRDYGTFTVDPDPSFTAVPAQDAGSCSGPVANRYAGLRIPPGDVACFAPTVPYTTLPNLAGHTDPRYRGFDMRYSDVDRMTEWQREFQGYILNSDLPALEIMWLPEDHTSTAPAFVTQPSDVALNDQAVGMLVDAVSHSVYWQNTAIFITQDDAQGSRDHVSAQRTQCLIISPFTRTGGLREDTGLYDHMSLLKTIEALLHLQPMSQFDLTASPMWSAFHPEALLQPYNSLPLEIPISYNPQPPPTTPTVTPTVPAPTSTPSPTVPAPSPTVPPTTTATPTVSPPTPAASPTVPATATPNPTASVPTTTPTAAASPPPTTPAVTPTVPQQRSR